MSMSLHIYLSSQQGEPTNIGRVGRLVDVLPVDGFDFLCELLREQNEWLSDELRTELRAELGQIEVSIKTMVKASQ